MWELSDSLVKAILAFAIVGALIGGFFMGLITSDLFMPIATLIVSYFFNEKKINSLESTIRDKESIIASLSTSNDNKIVVIKDGKKENV